MTWIVWFARNPVAANLLMLLIMVGGLLSLPTAEQYVYPREARDMLEIRIRYPGAGPGETEQMLCVPIEEAVYNLEGVIAVDSIAQQELCKVLVKFDESIGFQRIQADVKARLDALTVLPQEAERLQITELMTGVPAVIVAVYGESDALTLLHLRDRLQAELSKRPEVGYVKPYPEHTFELSIEIPPQALRRHRLSFDDVARAIRRASKNIPAGELESDSGKMLLRSKAQALVPADFARIELRAMGDGRPLLLGDIADIRETVAELDWQVRFDGHPAAEVVVFPNRQVSATVAAVNDVIGAFQAELPAGVDIATWDDWSKYYRNNMTMLGGNIVSAFLLVFLILMLFLKPKLALWVSAGIAVSFLGALWTMSLFGISLNVYSITALILVLGIVVDDAIVVGENVYRHQIGHPGLAGAVDGTKEVAVLVVLMVLSTAVAFLPGCFLPGLSGRLMSNVAVVVILALLFSMLEALFILPAHLAAIAEPVQKSPLDRLQAMVDAGLQRFIDRLYVPTLELFLRFRYPVWSGFVVLLAVTAALVVSGRIPSIMEAPINNYYLAARINLPSGTPFDEVYRRVLRLENVAGAIRKELNAERPAGAPDSFQHVFAIAYDNWGFVDLEIAIDEDIRTRLDDIKRRWGSGFGEVPEQAQLSFQTFWPKELGVGASEAGKAIELQLTAPDPAQQRAAGEMLQAALSDISGVHSVSGSMQAGKPELRLHLKEAAKFYGLTSTALGEQVRQGFFGLEAQRYIAERDEIRVMLRYPKSFSRSLDDLDNMPIRLPDGSDVPFSAVAEAEPTPGFATIERHNRRRTLVVGAEVYRDRANAENVLAGLRAGLIPELERKFPGLRIEPGQSRQEQGEAMSKLWQYGLLALLAIYALLAVPLRSYLQPLIIMSAIPFGFIGAVGGHAALGLSLTLDSYIALFAVAGVVVNDSLVLVAFINRELPHATDIRTTLLQAGRLRFRPIVLTTLTTFFGLMPLLTEQGPDAEAIMPMAVSLGFGVLFSTLVTLLLVPISYLMLDDLKKLAPKQKEVLAAVDSNR
ncbi:MAG: efflux RND transporter permease subunit [Gammaproteobacteria bacterium]